MNGWGYYLSTPVDGKTVSLKNNCDPLTGRYYIYDSDSTIVTQTPTQTVTMKLNEVSYTLIIGTGGVVTF